MDPTRKTTNEQAQRKRTPEEDAQAAVAPQPASPAPPEDESADPVGDGHSDAEWAARHPERKR